ncbi:MAG: methylmalonyl Co-A mutase-associated GTPase MeaB [Caldilineaceae bacterium]
MILPVSDTLRRRTVDAEVLAEGIVAGDRLRVARAISHVENEGDHAHSILSRVYPHTGRARIIGVTGAPGSGKSTLVTALAQSYRAAGLTVAVVAIDPTSPYTGGALLGDRVRMAALSGDEGVFIRSMATRGSLGGLSKTTGDVVTVLDAAGYDRILVETVGVGQAEVDIASTAHTTLVVEAPGMGDEVQAIKAGILEIGDVLVVNKADRAGADRTVKALEMMLEIENSNARLLRHHGQVLRVDARQSVSPQDDAMQTELWRVTVMKTIAASHTGVDELRERIEEHGEWLHSSGEIAWREHVRAAHLMENILRGELNRRIQARLPQDSVAELVERVYRREADPYTAAQDLLSGI